MKKQLALLLVLSFALAAWCPWAASAAPTAVLLNDPALPNADPALMRTLASTVQAAGYAPVFQTVADMQRPQALATLQCALLVLPQAQQMPVALIPIVTGYLKAGGHLLALGLPAWSVPLVPGSDGRWVTPAEAGEAQALLPAPHSVFDFGAADLASWQRTSNQPEPAAQIMVAPVEALGRPAQALHVVLPALTGYDTFISPSLPSIAFPGGRTMTVFSARGGPRTSRLAVEWDEKDGSRWIATIPLTAHWQRYSLPQSVFHSWANTDERARLGFHPGNADRFSVGLAFSHTGTVGGAHEYWVAQVGTATPAEVPASPMETPPVPPLETLAPAYKFSPIHGAVRLTVAPDQAMVQASSEPIQPPSALVSSPPRPSGAGFAKGRAGRWISLLLAEDARTGEWRGSPGTLWLRPPGPSNGGSVWAAFTPTDAGFYRQPAMQAVLTQTARRMRDGLFLVEGGAEFNTYFPGQPVRLGAEAANLAAPGGQARSGLMSVTVTDASGHVQVERAWPMTLERGGRAAQEFSWNPPTMWPAGGYRVTARLRENGQTVDSVQHSIWVSTLPAHPDWMVIRPDGHFSLDGRLWRANGVNYLPSSGIAQEDGELYENWLSRAAYDPEIVERDLTHIESLGLNAVSVFVYDRASESQNLLDLLRRCRRHHLHVNLSLRPGVSNELQEADRDEAERKAWETFAGIITRYHLAENDTVFAYEIDWEPDFRRFGRQKRTDADWVAWVHARYGSLAAAELAWGVAAPRDPAGHLTGPSGDQMRQAGGPGMKMIAAYRHFLDDWLAETYGLPSRRIHALAPHQFVSFRMTGASDPLWDNGGENYQFEGLSRAVDFLSPESYGQINQPDGPTAIPFRIAYGRSVAPQEPILWAETGLSVWDGQADDPDALNAQGAYYARFYALARASGADGIFWWWYPGGYRVGENSDYGLLNPDGTDRPAAAAIRREGPAFLAAPPPPPLDVWLDYNRDQHPDGAIGIFRDLKGAFAAGLALGHHPGLRAAPSQ